MFAVARLISVFAALRMGTSVVEIGGRLTAPYAAPEPRITLFNRHSCVMTIKKSMISVSRSRTGDMYLSWNSVMQRILIQLRSWSPGNGMLRFDFE